MNERIQELWEQATFDESRIVDGIYHPYIALQFAGEPVRYSITDEQREKFAELLIQECASIAAGFSAENKRFHPDIYPGDMPMDRRMVYHSTCQSVAYEIKEHFGVEEQNSTCPDCGADGGTQCGSINCGY